MKIDIEKILTIAAKAFSDQGFDALSMRALADKCGISAPALYYHFESKEALYTEVCNNLLDTILEEIDSAMITAKTSEERLEIFIQTVFDCWANTPLRILTQRDAINAAMHPDKMLAKNHFKRLIDHTQQIFTEPYKTAINPQAAFGLTALIFGYVSLLPYDLNQTYYQSEQAHTEQSKKDLINMCLSILRMRKNH